ncbi:fumarylacetoacetate hydrolase family protein [Cryptosporangium sp. NPDC048952]|uniref:fumarylacetoacetate hydrolase family protein n=1 Tax=Cryptosporangium sp. NPDC048952 TaxID=3363961 RepID=UPI003714FF9A
MRLANCAGRLVLITGDASQGSLPALDVETASEGLFSADPQAIYARWAEFRAWAESAQRDAATPVAESALGPVVPRPAQVFAIGLNYRDHAAESGFALPTAPVVFTKYVSSFTGPTGDITLSPGDVDWEVELVVVIGTAARRVDAADGWNHVAGLTVGQDISDRTAQFAAPPAQFGLGKSFPGYSPIGPVLVTPDEFDDPDRLTLGCEVNGTAVQKGTTADLVFSVSTLVAELSSTLELLPGDVIFTGTPAGVGHGRTPPQYLRAGDELTSWVSGIGVLRHRFVSA